MRVHRVSAGYKACPKGRYYAAVGTGFTPNLYPLGSTACPEESCLRIAQKDTPVKKREVDVVAAWEQLAQW